MGLFVLKQVKMDTERSDESKRKMHALFQQNVEEADTYHVVYGFTSDTKTSNYILASKTTYSYGSLIIGYRESDIALVLLETNPNLDGCGDPFYMRKNEIKKARFNDTKAKFVFQLSGGLFGGKKLEIAIMSVNDYDHIAYVEQYDEAMDWYEFFQKFNTNIRLFVCNKRFFLFTKLSNQPFLAGFYLPCY